MYKTSAPAKRNLSDSRREAARRKNNANAGKVTENISVS
jgi:hypothetical protein